MSRGLAWLLVMAGTMLWAEIAAAQGRKPKLPAGFDPGGVAIAILSTGIDYRAADIAQRLARDGEGDLIGWDLVDRDNRPFNAVAAETPAALGGDANALIRAIGQPGRRVVPVRIDARDPVSLARAASFVAQTPARIVVVPMWTANADEWATLRHGHQGSPRPAVHRRGRRRGARHRSRAGVAGRLRARQPAGGERGAGRRACTGRRRSEHSGPRPSRPSSMAPRPAAWRPCWPPTSWPAAGRTCSSEPRARR